ncbi:MAG: hypothetical protein DIZ80_04770 [endosymbiont of Galathealinum brachiosum]|uniref:Lipoprotein n=1 Tax=endosymbiont of Galathealinum brachiosum TaxID=2200906 RepID=A0A370DIP1_9GAMM|nr:MAG: hypothetical protein DIZ80_04770 [endosymbiont of Galathealinum brachiosum]
MLRVQSLLLLCSLVVLSACSTSAKGPVTNREYKVQMGGWQDMDEYNRLRDKAVQDKSRTEDDIIDCNVVDCPEMIRKNGTE